MNANTVQVAELRLAATRIFDALERAHGSSITVDEDYYWHLPVRDAYAMYEEPSICDAGQLSDDLADIRRTLADLEEEPVLWHDLAHLIAVLRFLEKISLP